MFKSQELVELRQQFATGIFRKGYYETKGYTLPESYQKIEKQIEDFEVFDDDVWITTFPKCGTTWTQEMVWCILHDMNFESAKEETDIRMPFIEFCCILAPSEPEYSVFDPGYVGRSVELARDAKRPRIIKTHLPFVLLPRQIQTFERNPKIIHVYRNMKDTCVSYYHHSRLLEGFSGDFQLFWKLFINGQLIFTPMLSNILSYWQHRNRPNFLFIRFEHMKSDLRSVILDICKFFNKTYSEEEIQSLLNHVSFESMKNNTHVDKHRVVEFSKKIGACKTDIGNFIRVGKSGGYKSEMSDEVEHVFDEHARIILSGTGLSFD